MKEAKNKRLIQQPLLLLIDPTMQDNKLSIKVREPLLIDYDAILDYQTRHYLLN